MKLSEAQQAAHDAILKMVQSNPEDSGTANYDGLTEEAINESGLPAEAPTPEAQAPAHEAAPKADLSGPLGLHETGDAELSKLQSDAKARRKTAVLGNAVNDYADRPTNLLDYAQRLGGGGVSASPRRDDRWDKYAAEGDRALDDLKARRESEAGMLAKDKAAAEFKSMNDPESDESKFAQSLVERYAPGVDVAGKSAAQIGKFAPFVLQVIRENGDLMRADLAAKAKAAADAKKAEKDAAQAKFDAEKFAEAKRHNLATEANGAKYAAQAAAQKKSEEKQAKSDKEHEVPGYVHDGGTMLTPAERSKARSTTPAIKAISADIDKLIPLIEKFGTEQMPGPAKAEMEALTTNILAHTKGPAAYELGVLAGPDMAIMEKALGNATELSLSNALNPYAGQNIIVKLRTTKESLNQKHQMFMESLGYSPAPSGKAPASSSSKGHGEVVFEGEGLREYADGFIEEVD